MRVDAFEKERARVLNGLDGDVRRAFALLRRPAVVARVQPSHPRDTQLVHGEVERVEEKVVKPHAHHKLDNNTDEARRAKRPAAGGYAEEQPTHAQLVPHDNRTQVSHSWHDCLLQVRQSCEAVHCVARRRAIEAVADGPRPKHVQALVEGDAEDEHCHRPARLEHRVASEGKRRVALPDGTSRGVHHSRAGYHAGRSSDVRAADEVGQPRRLIGLKSDVSDRGGARMHVQDRWPPDRRMRGHVASDEAARSQRQR